MKVDQNGGGGGGVVRKRRFVENVLSKMGVAESNERRGYNDKYVVERGAGGAT